MGSVNPVEKHNPLLDVKSRTSSLTQSPPGKGEAGYPLRKCSAPKQQQCTWSFPRKSLWLLVQLHGLGQEEYSKCHHGSPCKAKTSGGQAVISNSSWYKPTPFCHCDLCPQWIPNTCRLIHWPMSWIPDVHLQGIDLTPRIWFLTYVVTAIEIGKGQIDENIA